MKNIFKISSSSDNITPLSPNLPPPFIGSERVERKPSFIFSPQFNSLSNNGDGVIQPLFLGKPNSKYSHQFHLPPNRNPQNQQQLQTKGINPPSQFRNQRYNSLPVAVSSSDKVVLDHPYIGQLKNQNAPVPPPRSLNRKSATAPKTHVQNISSNTAPISEMRMDDFDFNQSPQKPPTVLSEQPKKSFSDTSVALENNSTDCDTITSRKGSSKNPSDETSIVNSSSTPQSEIYPPTVTSAKYSSDTLSRDNTTISSFKSYKPSSEGMAIKLKKSDTTSSASASIPLSIPASRISSKHKSTIGIVSSKSKEKNLTSPTRKLSDFANNAFPKKLRKQKSASALTSLVPMIPPPPASNSSSPPLSQSSGSSKEISHSSSQPVSQIVPQKIPYVSSWLAPRAVPQPNLQQQAYQFEKPSVLKQNSQNVYQQISNFAHPSYQQPTQNFSSQLVSNPKPQATPKIAQQSIRKVRKSTPRPKTLPPPARSSSSSFEVDGKPNVVPQTLRKSINSAMDFEIKSGSRFILHPANGMIRH